jgi:hypothetical protein
MSDGLDAIVNAIDELHHTNFQTEPYDSGVKVSFKIEKRYFRINVTSEYIEDYDAAKNPLDRKKFQEALRSTPNGNLTVSRAGFIPK